MKTTLKLLSLSSALILGLITNQSQSYSKEIDPKSDLLISNSIENKEIKTVESLGYGSSIDEAAQQAAINALKQVVGLFIDAKTILRDETKINNGIIQESIVIKENIREYTQGSIKYFEIISKEKYSDSLYEVKARVDVRIKDFKAYIQKFGYSKSDFPGKNIATVINTNKDIANQALLFLADKVVKPLLERSVYEFKLGEPELLKDNKVRIPLSFYISEAFIENLKIKLESINTISEIPYRGKSVPYTLKVIFYDDVKGKKYSHNIKMTEEGLINLNNDYCQNKMKYYSKSGNCGYNQYSFLFDQHSNKAKAGWRSDFHDLLNSDLTLPLHISLIGNEGEVIKKVICGFSSCYENKKNYLLQALRDKAYVDDRDQESYSIWLKENNTNRSRMLSEQMYKRLYPGFLSFINWNRFYNKWNIRITTQKDFWLYLNFDPDELSKIKDIEIKFEKLNFQK